MIIIIINFIKISSENYLQNFEQSSFFYEIKMS